MVPAGGLPDDAAAARATLARRYGEAPDGSRERTDLGWLLELARREGPWTPGVPPGRARTVALALRVNAWWYAERGSPAQRVVLRDPDGLILNYREGHGFGVNPVATTGRWHDLNAGYTPEALADALMPLAVARRAGDRTFWVWDYYDVGDDPAAVRPGVSGMAQARLAQLLAHAWHRTGEPRYARASLMALGAFAAPVDEGGATAEVAYPEGTPASPWYVERAYPGESPWKGAALNGFMVAILSLRATAADLRAAPRTAVPEAPADEPPAPPDEGDPAERAGSPEEGSGSADAGDVPAAPAGPAPPATATAPAAAPAEVPPAPAATAPPPSDAPDAPGPGPVLADEGATLARGLADAGAATLERYLPLHDSGDWSYYGMLTPGRPWRSYLADLNYHCYHVALLERLDPLYPREGFGSVATRWAGYVTRAGATCPAR
jgi:hypothetical protein